MPLRVPSDMEWMGERLYGEDFSPQEMSEWFEDEREAYARLGSGDRDTYRYPYHAVNVRHGFRHLPTTSFTHALGIGSAYGDEFTPLQGRIGAVTIIEPSTALRGANLPFPVEYREPNPFGDLPVASSSVDLVLCLGVLHHVPNVSTLIAEIARVLRPDAYALIREPTVSMGDWTRPRPGLTAHERGIPLRLLRGFVKKAELAIVKETRYAFPLTSRLARWARLDAHNSVTLVRFDEIMCRLFTWNRTYHALRGFHKMRPTAVFLVLRKHPQRGL